MGFYPTNSVKALKEDQYRSGAEDLALVPPNPPHLGYNNTTYVRY